MNKRCAVLVVLGIGFWLLTQVFVPGFVSAGGTALVYNGRWSAEEAPEALADVIRSVGLEVRYFSRPQDLLTLLDGAELIAFGGTEDDTRGLRESFPENVVDAIQEFTAGGGRYCGVCGGAYLAADRWEEYGPIQGFGLAPVEPDTYMGDYDPMLLPVVWNGEARKMYYQGGPYFEMLESDEAVEILARYEDGEVAALVCAYGMGKVLLSGPHPEAPVSWLEYEDLPVRGWKSSIDLMQAALRDLLSDRRPGE